MRWISFRCPDSLWSQVRYTGGIGSFTVSACGIYQGHNSLTLRDDAWRVFVVDPSADSQSGASVRFPITSQD
jgi:hypothetical protein